MEVEPGRFCLAWPTGETWYVRPIPIITPIEVILDVDVSPFLPGIDLAQVSGMIYTD
jgi:hypothetical protein